MMYQYPQLHADASTISWVIPRLAFYDYVEAFVRAGLGKRLMFGSDQMRWPRRPVVSRVARRGVLSFLASGTFSRDSHHVFSLGQSASDAPPKLE